MYRRAEETKHAEKCENGLGIYVVSFYLLRWRLYPGEWMAHAHASLEPRLYIFSKAVRQNPERKAWVRSYTHASEMFQKQSLVPDPCF